MLYTRAAEETRSEQLAGPLYSWSWRPFSLPVQYVGLLDQIEAHPTHHDLSVRYAAAPLLGTL